MLVCYETKSLQQFRSDKLLNENVAKLNGTGGFKHFAKISLSRSGNLLRPSETKW